MNRPLAAWTLLSLAALASTGVPARAGETRIAALIEALGSPEWEAREEAQALLVRLGCRVLPALEAATGSCDLEVAGRAAQAWQAIRSSLPGDDVHSESIAELEEVLSRDPAGGRPDVQEAIAAARAGLDARLVEIEGEDGTILLDRGVDQGVSPGLVFLVYRERSFVATLVVEAASPGRSLARVDPARSIGAVEAGDAATTLEPAKRLAALERASELTARYRAEWMGE